MASDIETLYSIYKRASSVSIDPKEPQKDSFYVALKNRQPKKLWAKAGWHVWRWLEMHAPNLRPHAIKLGSFLSRAINADSLNEVYDGNAYTNLALANGAMHALIDNRHVHQPPKTTLVENATDTLYALALHHRTQIDQPIIGITGSVGKTTTTNLVYEVLKSEQNAYMDKRRNSPAGNSVNLLNLPKGAAAVFEMGTIKPGLLAEACKFLSPTHAIITTIDKAHLDTFKDLAEIQTSKWEMFDHIINTNGTAFVNMNHQWLASQADKIPNKVTYGSDPECDVYGTMLSADPFLKLRWHPADQAQPIDIQTKLAGQHNVDNVLAAIAVGIHFGISQASIKKAIEAFEPIEHRSEIYLSGSNTIYCETYQANPASTMANLDSFAQYSASKKVLILGPIARISNDHEIYDQVIEKVKLMDIDQVFFLTNEFDRFRDQEIGLHVSGRKEIKAWLEENQPENTTFMLNLYDGYYDIRGLFPVAD